MPPTETQTNPSIQLGDTVKAVNRDSNARYVAWNNRRYELPPNEEAFVPIEAIINSLGDPRATDNVASIRTPEGVVHFVADRETERRRILNLYNAGGPSLDAPKFPNVEVYSLKGERIFTVADDPLGDHTTPATTTVADQHSQNARIAQLEDQLARLTARLESQGGVNLGTDDTPSTRTDGLPEDSDGAIEPEPGQDPAHPITLDNVDTDGANDAGQFGEPAS